VRLQGKVVVITGAGGGIGEGFARRFAAEGAQVVLGDLAERVLAVAAEAGGVGLVGDMTVEADVQALHSLAQETHGRVDIWFSNAGIATPRRPAQIPADDEWDRMWRLHVMAHVFAARAVLPGMLGRGDGYLIQTVSRVALGAHPGKAAYSVTKHASLALGEWLAIQFRQQGVKVSCFCPGAMQTPMLLANLKSDDDPRFANALSPETVADILVRGIEAEKFLITTPDAGTAPLEARVADWDAWLGSLNTV